MIDQSILDMLLELKVKQDLLQAVKDNTPTKGYGTGYCVTCDTIISKNKAQCRKCAKIDVVVVED